jgi:hypothetical protein
MKAINKVNSESLDIWGDSVDYTFQINISRRCKDYTFNDYLNLEHYYFPEKSDFNYSFIEISKKWSMIGHISVPNDFDHNIWMDDDGVIHVSISDSETIFAWNVADSWGELMELWYKYVEICEFQINEFQDSTWIEASRERKQANQFCNVLIYNRFNNVFGDKITRTSNIMWRTFQKRSVVPINSSYYNSMKISFMEKGQKQLIWSIINHIMFSKSDHDKIKILLCVRKYRMNILFIYDLVCDIITYFVDNIPIN